MSEFQFLSVEAYEEYNDGFECCVGCMEKNVSFVNLKTCKHAGVLSLLCKDLIQILDSTSEIVPLCFICHALLKKAYNFKLQVEESYHILHSKSRISSVKHNKTHHSKLEKRTAADIYLSIKKEDDSLLEDYEVEVKVEPKEESRDDLASVEGHSEVEGSDSYDVEPTQSTTEEPKPKSKCRESEYKGMLNFITLNEEEMLRERDLERQSLSYQNLPYKCEKCIVGFDHSVSLERHNNIRHDTKLGSHKCHICESVLRSEATFKDHVTRHYLRKASAMRRMSRSHSRSRSRSRSATPGPEPSHSAAAALKRRRLLFDNLGPIKEPQAPEEEPKLWRPQFNTAMEKAAVMDLDEEEGNTAEEDHFDQKWFSELQTVEHLDPVPYSYSMASPIVPEVASGGVIEIIGFETSEPHDSALVTPGTIDVQPSTSGMVRASTNAVRIDNEGSELDSDFDDEFETEEVHDFAGTGRDIPPDDELTETQRNVVNSVSRAMDEAIDHVVSVPTVFTWQNDFDSFRGVPEQFSGPSPGPVDDYDTPYDVFVAIWNKDFVENIVLETNRYARQEMNSKTAAGTLKDSSRLRRWTDTNVDEMLTFFSIYIFMGLDHRISQHEYWKTTGYLEMPKFRMLMSYNRYILLSKFIHFVDNSDVSQNLPQSDGTVLSAKLAKIAPVITHLNESFSKLYNLHQDIAIDESLTLYKGRLTWVQAIRTKAAHFGIKSFELCESRTGYLYKFEIYTGKNSERSGNAAISVDLGVKSTQVVLDLLKGLEHRGHLVTMDNFYNCPALARHLKGLGFDCLGTLRPNRKHVPVDIAKASKSVPKGTIVARHSGDITCLAWMDSKMVNMISTYHTAETFVGRKAGRDHVKPLAVRDYNNTMGGVDLKDQKLSLYVLERKRCVKWYMKMFKRLLNKSILNAFVMFTESLRRRGKPLMTHREFRECLATSIAEKHCQKSQQYVVEADTQVLRLNKCLLHVPEIFSGPKSRMPCRICLRNGKEKKVHLKCSTCDEFMCPVDCWRTWHSVQQLPGRDIKSRKGRRCH